MATREVVGVVRRPDGSPWVGARLRFRLDTDTHDVEALYPVADVVAVTDENGSFRVRLWPNELGATESRYEVTLPSGQKKRITVPAGTTDIELGLLIEAGVTPADPQYPTLVTYVDQLVKEEVSGQIGAAVAQTAQDADRAEAARAAAEAARDEATIARTAAEAARDAAQAAAAQSEAAAAVAHTDDALYLPELPASPAIGRRIYSVEWRKPYWWDGETWRDATGEALSQDVLFWVNPRFDLARIGGTFSRSGPATYIDRG